MIWMRSGFASQIVFLIEVDKLFESSLNFATGVRWRKMKNKLPNLYNSPAETDCGDFKINHNLRLSDCCPPNRLWVHYTDSRAISSLLLIMRAPLLSSATWWCSWSWMIQCSHTSAGVGGAHSRGESLCCGPGGVAADLVRLWCASQPVQDPGEGDGVEA